MYVVEKTAGGRGIALQVVGRPHYTWRGAASQVVVRPHYRWGEKRIASGRGTSKGVPHCMWLRKSHYRWGRAALQVGGRIAGGCETALHAEGDRIAGSCKTPLHVEGGSHSG